MARQPSVASRHGSLDPQSHFRAELAARSAGADASARTQWFLVLPDQLHLGVGPWAGAKPRESAIVLVESGEWLSRRPYHKQRLGWIMLSQRAFALEAADAGFAVVYLRSDEPMSEQVRAASAGRRLHGMDPAEREVRAEFAPLVASGLVSFQPHDGFLTTATDLERGRTADGWRMDRFYQGVRQRTGILMERGKPVGGKYSFDADNRKRWDGSPTAPTPPSFPASLLREEVVSDIERCFAQHPGVLDLDVIPASSTEVDRLWTWAKRMCLPNFGPFEDAMSRKSRGVFHTRISAAMNLHRILPRRVVDDVAALDIDLSSKEGFIRQVLGWREFVYQVHRATDGFRAVASAGEEPSRQIGDAGYARWAGKPWIPKAAAPEGVDGGARPNRLGAESPLPAAWWGRESGLACLDHVVDDVWQEGWSHHITRLMVLSNVATLAGISPRELCDWFWIAYIDAWDWVVEPNVLGMSTYGYDGMTTKPYVSGSAYLEKMGDSCSTCQFTPGKDCPIGPMYWAFLARNAGVLGDNPRMKLPMASTRARTDAQRSSDHAVFVALRDVLVEGRPYVARGAADATLFASNVKRGRK